MSNLSYLWIFATATLLALSLTPIARRIALRFDILDRPGDRKSHAVAMPYLGGLALVGSVLGAAALFAVVRPPVSSLGELLVVLGVALLIAGLGFRDDVRYLSPLTRLGVEFLAAIVMWMIGVRIGVFGSPPLDFAATVLWVVGLVNAQNFIDNADGLSAGTAAAASGWVVVIAAVNGQFLVASLAAGVMGCAVGFLWYNIHPAKIYMGDGGSLFLGFLLAYLTIKLRIGGAASLSLSVPLLIMGVPIFDTMLVVVERVRHGRSPMLGGTDHTSHRLMHLGLSVRSAVLVIVVVGILIGGVALIVSRTSVEVGSILAGVIFALMLVAGVWLGRVPVYDREARTDGARG